MPFVATWMKIEIFTLGEVSQKEKDKHHIESKTGTNDLSTKQKCIKDLKDTMKKITK